MTTYIRKYEKTYMESHQHVGNLICHLFGIPLIIASMVMLFLSIPVAGILFLLGWMFQFFGHAIEGKKPKFFEEPIYLVVGPIVLAKEVVQRLSKVLSRKFQR